MAATLPDIKRWFKDGVAQKATHMIVVCDTFDYDDYPMYANGLEDFKKKWIEATTNMQRPMEVYDLSMSMESQSNPTSRVWNYPEGFTR